MATQIDIIAKSLIALGEKPISDIDEDTDIAQVMRTVYDDLKKGFESSYPWNFTKKTVQLARLTSTPTVVWDYAYQIPSDCLKVLEVYNSTSGEPVTDWDTQYQQILTNYDTVYIVYQADISEPDLPIYFVNFFAAALAEEVCMTITDNVPLKELLYIKAFGNPSDNLIGGLNGMARRLDAMNKPSKIIKLETITDSRLI